MLVASMILHEHDDSRSIAELQYRRALSVASVNRDKESIALEDDRFYQLFNRIAGTNFSPELNRQAMVKSKIEKYEAILGCKVDSDEFRSRVDDAVTNLLKRNR